MQFLGDKVMNMSASHLKKTPPANIEAEQALLCSVFLLGDKLLAELEGTMSATDFHDPRHRKIFSAVEHLLRNGRVVDLVTITDELINRGQLDQAGGAAYLASLTENIPGVISGKAHAQIVLKKARLRRIIEVTGSAIDGAYRGEDPDGLIEGLGQMIIESANAKGPNRARNASQIAPEALLSIKSRIGAGSRLRGVPTGFSELDHMTAGFQPSDLIILAARPSMGKTALAMNKAVSGALAGNKILIFSLEMSSRQLFERALSALAEVPLSAIRCGDLSENMMARVVHAGQNIISNLPITIDDTAGLSIGQLRARARAEAIKGGVDLIVVDYLQLMRAPGSQNREREVAEISSGLKGLAKDLNVPVLALSQLNRSLESRTDRTPRLSDLRDSGSIEQDADLVLLLHRDSKAGPDSPMFGKAEVIVSKHRNGPTGSIYLKFEPHFCRFSDA